MMIRHEPAYFAGRSAVQPDDGTTTVFPVQTAMDPAAVMFQGGDTYTDVGVVDPNAQQFVPVVLTFPSVGVQQAFNQIRQLIATGVYTSTNWIPIVTSLMVAMAEVRGMSGPQKKAVAVDLSVQLLNEVPLPTPQDKQAFLNFAVPLIGSAIDTVYDAATGKFDVKESLADALKRLTQRYDNKEVFERLYRDVKRTIGTSDLSVANILTLVPVAMAAVKRAVSANGARKKELVIALVTRLASEIPVKNPNEKIALQTMVTLTVPSLVDTMYQAASGKFDFGKLRDCSCCG